VPLAVSGDLGNCCSQGIYGDYMETERYKCYSTTTPDSDPELVVPLCLTELYEVCTFNLGHEQLN
jgi:hypothetical protein